MFFSILTADYKHPLLNRDSLSQPIQTQLSQKQKIFSQFVSAFLKSRLNFEHFQTKMLVKADAFPKLWNPKNVVNQISKKSPFIPPFKKQHARGTKHC